MSHQVRFQPLPKLLPQDLVSVVALSGPFDRASFEAGLAILKSRYRVRVDDSVFETHRYLAGTDVQRLAQWNNNLASGEVKALFAARGGYGAMRLLPQLKFGALPRPVVGFSDMTAIHLAAQSVGLRSVHAPVLTQLGTQPPDAVSRLFDILEGRLPSPLFGTHCIQSGIAEGPLLGGNLAMLASLLGTPYLPDFAGAVLLLEDIGERPYRLDRMLTHLTLSGVLTGLSGIVLGDFTNCEEKDAAYSSHDVVSEWALSLGVPCVSGFRIGHGEVNLAVVLGARVRLDASAFTLHFREGLSA
jgi:muramoyltetrapeptide carboxypeptidase